MRKLSVFLSLIMLTAFLTLPFGRAAFAAQDDDIKTEIFLPTSYLQYYKLDNPYALCRYVDDDGGEVMAISHKNAIVIYRDEKFSSLPLDLLDNQVKTIGHYGNFILYVYDLKIYAIDITGFNESDWNYEANVEDTGISCNTFSVCGDTLVTATESNVYFYRIKENKEKFERESEYFKTFRATKPSNLLYSDDGKLYYDCSDDSAIYVYDGEESKTLLNAEGSVRYLSGDSERLFFTTDKGVYEYIGGEIKTIKEIEPSGEDDLGTIKNPLGICPVEGDKIWIVDGTINAVQEIDLKDNSFTQFAITTNSNAINRLSAGVKDVTVDGDKIYALDDGRIVVINDIYGVNTYNRILTEDGVELFDVGDGYLCYAKGENVKLLKISDEGEADLVSTEIYSGKVAEIADIAYRDEKFYLLANKVVGGEVFPTVYSLGVDGTLDELQMPNVQTGKGLKIAVDVFGVIYFAAENSNTYNFYSLNGDLKSVYSERKVEKLLRIQTDFDGKVFALYQHNEIRCYSEGEQIYSKKLILSDNIMGVGDALSMCLSYESETAYFLFGGLILKSAKDADMEISTPDSVSFPDDFSINYSENTPFTHLKKNSKLFSIDLSDRSYTECLTASDENIAYVKFPLGEKYALIINDDTSAIVRISDTYGDFKAKGATSKTYALVDFNIYSIPVLKGDYVIGSAEKYESLEKTSEIEFNGVEYYAVNAGGKVGYIPKSFVSDNLVSAKDRQTLSTAIAYSRYGVTVYSDENLTEQADLLKEKTEITVIDAQGDVIKVKYGEKYGYMSINDVYSSGRSNIVKAIAVVLVALSLLVVWLFFVSKFFGKERKSINE